MCQLQPGARTQLNKPACLQESTKVENVVTIGANLLSNTSDSYASFAVLMYQAFGRKVRCWPRCLELCEPCCLQLLLHTWLQLCCCARVPGCLACLCYTCTLCQPALYVPALRPHCSSLFALLRRPSTRPA